MQRKGKREMEDGISFSIYRELSYRAPSWLLSLESQFHTLRILVVQAYYFQ
jgi:hypothetical protein